MFVLPEACTAVLSNCHIGCCVLQHRNKTQGTEKWYFCIKQEMPFINSLYMWAVGTVCLYCNFHFISLDVNKNEWLPLLVFKTETDISHQLVITVQFFFFQLNLECSCQGALSVEKLRCNAVHMKQKCTLTSKTNPYVSNICIDQESWILQ